MLDKTTWEDILGKLIYWQTKDELVQESLNRFMKQLAPDSHRPVRSPDFVQAYIEAIGLLRGDEVKEWLEYLAYEVRYGETFIVTSKSGIAYDFGIAGHALAFFQKEYPLD